MTSNRPGRLLTTLAVTAMLIAVGCSGEDPPPEPQGLPFHACEGVVPDEALMQVTGRERDQLHLSHVRGFRVTPGGDCYITDGSAELVYLSIGTFAEERFRSGRDQVVESGRGQDGSLPDSIIFETHSEDIDLAGRRLFPREDSDRGYVIIVELYEAAGSDDPVADIELLLEHASEFYETWQPRELREPSTSS